jgi:hypothetical protein
MFKQILKINLLNLFKQWQFLMGSLLSLVLLLFGLEAYAFSQPLVTKTREIVGHATTIAQAVIGLGIVWFIFTLLMSRPNFRILICTTFAGVMIAGFATFVGFFGGR